MNKIYKVVWNKVRNAYVVASEFASGKDASALFQASVVRKTAKLVARTMVAGALAVGILSAGGGQLAYAATIRGTATNYYQYAAIKAGTGEFNNSSVIYITEDNQILKNENGTVYTEKLQDLATGSHVYANGTTYSRGETPYDSKTGAYNLMYTENDRDYNTTAYKYILSDTAGYYFRENYTGTEQPGNFTDTEDVADNHLEIVYTGVGDPPTTVTYGTASDNDRVTNVNTNLHEELQKNESGTYTAATNSVGIKTNDYGATVIDGSKNANFIIKDNSTSWNTVAEKTISSGGYVNVATESDTGTLPDGFVVVTNIAANGDVVKTTGVSTATSGLYWDASNNRFLYNGKTVSSDNVYVINGQVGVFTTGDIKKNTDTTLYGNTAYVGDTIYTGTVYGKGNGVLQTKSNLSSDLSTYRYNSYWSVQETDDTMTMGDYSIADYHNDLTALYNNDQKLLRNDISKVAVKKATDADNTESAKISLYRNGSDTQAVDGEITLTASGGTGGISTSTTNNDRKLTLSGTNDDKTAYGKTFNLGSVVGSSADLVGSTETAATTGGDLKALTINGTQYGLKMNFLGDNATTLTENLGDTLRVTGGSGNITVTAGTGGTNDQLLVSLNNDVYLGGGTEYYPHPIQIKSSTGIIDIGSATDKKVNLNGVTGTGTFGDAKVGEQSGLTSSSYTAADATTLSTTEAETTGTFATGLDNTTWDGKTYVSGRAATEDQLKTVYGNVVNNATNITNNTNTINAGWKAKVDSNAAMSITPDNEATDFDENTLNFVTGTNMSLESDNTTANKITVNTAKDVGFNSVYVGGTTGDAVGYATTGGIHIGQQKTTYYGTTTSGDSDVENGNLYVTGLQNLTWDGEHYVSGRAATEDQLKLLAGEITSGVSATGNDRYTSAGQVAYDEPTGAGNLALIISQASVDPENPTETPTVTVLNTPVEITGLHDYYTTNFTSTTDTDGNQILTLTQNGTGLAGGKKEWTVTLPSSSDWHLIKNPDNTTDGSYTVNNEDDKKGTLELKVQNGSDTSERDTITIKNLATIGENGSTFGLTDNAKKAITQTLNNTIQVKGGTNTYREVQEVTTNKDGMPQATRISSGTSNQNIVTAVNDTDNSLDLNLSNTIKLGNETTNSSIDLYGSAYDDSTDTHRVHISSAEGISLRHTGSNGNNEQLDGITITGPYDVYDSNGERAKALDSNGSISLTNNNGEFTARLSDIGASGFLGLGNTLYTLKEAGRTDQVRNVTTTITTTDTSGNTTTSPATTEQKVARATLYSRYGTASLNPNANATSDTQTTTVTNADGSTTTTTVTNALANGGTAMTRLKYQDEDNITEADQPTVNSADGTTKAREHELATLDDGMQYSGDNYKAGEDTTVISKMLNNRLEVKGGADATKLTDNNIGVNANDGALEVKLAQHVNLDDDDYGSLTAGNVKVGLINDKGKLGIDYGSTSTVGNQGINLASGVYGTLWTTRPEAGSVSVADITANLNNAANIGDIYAIAGNAASTVAGKHTIVTVGGESAPVAGNGEFGNDVSGGNLLIRAKDDDGQKTYDLRLANNVVLGEPGVPGKDGQPGKDGVDGSIGLVGRDGADGTNTETTIIKTVGKNGTNGTDGKAGVDGVDGKDGITRIIYQGGSDGTDGKDGKEHIVATLDDGLKIGANAPEATGGANPVANKLNTTVNIVGRSAQEKHKYTTENLTTTVAKNGDDTTVTIKMDKDLADLNSITLGDKTTNNYTTINNEGIKITNVTNEGDKSITINNETIDMGDNIIHNVDNGVEDNDVVNVSQLKGAATVVTSKDKSVKIKHSYNETTFANTYDLSVDYSNVASNTPLSYTANGDTPSKTVTLSQGLNFIDGKNTKASVEDNGVVKYDVADDVRLGTNGKDGKDGSIGIAGKDGENGTTTTIIKTVGKNGTDGKPGVDGKDGINRIIYEDGEKGEDGKDGKTHIVATLDDGMQYGADNYKAGDDATVVNKQLNERLDVKGGAKGTLTEDNIGVNVVTKQDAEGKIVGDYLKVQLASNVDLDTKTNGTDNKDGSLKAGGVKVGNITKNVTTINADGTTTTTPTAARGVDYDGNQGVQLASGRENALWTENNVPEAMKQEKDFLNGNFNNAANIGDIYAIAQSTAKSIQQDGLHTEVTVEEGNKAGEGKDATTGESVYTGGNLKLHREDGADGHAIYDLKLSDNLELGQKGEPGKDGVNGSVGVNGRDGQNVTIDGENGITIRGKDGTDGKNGKDAVTIKGIDGKDGVDGAEGHIGLNGKDGMTDIHTDRGKDDVNGSHGKDGKDGEMGRIVYTDPQDGQPHEVATMDDGLKFHGDTGDTAAVKLNKQVDIVGGQTDKTQLSSGANIGVQSSQNGDNGKLEVKLAKDLKDLNSTTYNNNYGGPTIVNGGGIVINSGGTTVDGRTIVNDNSVAVTQEYVSMGGQKIHNVAPGTADTDAVNVSQLRGSVNNVNHAINKLDNRVNRVGAGAAALAALHPQDFNPDDKWDFAVGSGHYNGATAVAVGAFYRPTEDVMVSLGGATGGGEDLINLGLSFKLGRHNRVTNTRVAMAEDMLAMQNKIETLTKKVESLEAAGTVQSSTSISKDVTFPDVPENHWAYEYVMSLAKRGIVEGYPDGEYKGQRNMTRYEMAAIIYRALQNGAEIDANMGRSMEEFGNEIANLQSAYRFRVDRVAGEDNDRHKIERVRVNDKDDPDNNDYRDVYGSKIQKAVEAAEAAGA